MNEVTTGDAIVRLVVPKSIREAMKVIGRSQVILGFFVGKTQTSLAEPSSSLSKRKGGRLVFSGAVPEERDSGEAISRMKLQRLGQ